MSNNLITAAPLVSNSDGSRRHPAMPFFLADDHRRWRSWLAWQRLEVLRVWMEDDGAAAELLARFRAGARATALAAWAPPAPNGDGAWFALCVLDTEFGPCAYFARRVAGATELPRSLAVAAKIGGWLSRAGRCVRARVGGIATSLAPGRRAIGTGGWRGATGDVDLDATVTLSANQLREALDFINPDPSDDDQADVDLTSGVVYHQDDDGMPKRGMCCWNDDSDGVYPLAGEYVPQTNPQPIAHPDDLAVDRFAASMKAKMAASRANGRSGWDDPTQCTVESLSEMLRAHVEKGDPVDVANFCMMLDQRGSGIVSPPAPAAGLTDADLDVCRQWFSRVSIQHQPNVPGRRSPTKGP